MSYKKYRHISFGGNPPEKLQYIALDEIVQSGGGFVCDDQLWCR
jgi:hypothetical protein